ncbi:MAG: protein kinase domain-containing protein [Thermoanaerobaculia bacterium]
MSEALEITGTIVGRYRVLSIIGRGGMGDVYDAVDPTLGRHVALKILPPEATSDPRRLHRFQQEARAASALNHPHLVSIYEIGQDRAGNTDIHFIAMEKIDGVTLRELLAIERLTTHRAIELLLQVIDAVAAAHGAGIIHRDLKPDNIMITRTGYVKVLDFGLAKLQPEVALPVDPAASTLDAPTAPGEVMGTAGYMSPEQARGKPVDHRSDLFSIGCILYEAVTGQRAFRAATPIDTLHEILHAEPPPLRETVAEAPAELQRIARKSLAKNPEERYQSAREMAIDLRGLLRAEPPETAAGTQAVDSRRLRRTSLAIVSAAILFALAAVLFLVARRRAVSPTAQMQRLTVRGDVTEAAISPDGNYIAFVAWTKDGQSLILRQLATGQDLELIPPVSNLSTLEFGFWGHTFTPDGTAILYGVKRAAEPHGALYRISTLGGRSEHVLDGIDSSVSFSPDGKRMAYLRADFPSPGESALMVVSSDGSGARPIAIRRPPERFVPIFFAAPSWSHDGRLIATAVERTAHPATAKVIGFDPENGHETIVADGGWKFVGQVAWLPNGNGLIVLASDVVEEYPPAQIWLVAEPSGIPRQLTHDVDQYRIASLSADGRSLLSVAFQRTSSIWRIPLARPDQFERMTTGNFDGFKGVSYLPDGRIVFSCLERGKTQLSVANLQTHQSAQITRDRYSNQFPVAFAGGIAYISSTPDDNEVCVTSFDGEGRRVIAHNVDQSAIAVSPDGRSLVYSANGKLWKMPMSGGVATQLFDAPSLGPSFSPAGDRIAFYYRSGTERRLGIIRTEGGHLDWSVPATFYTPCVRWLPGGNALLVNGYGGNLPDLWKLSIHGEAARVTNLYEQLAMAFDISPDGKTIALARGQVMRDAVLLTGFQ